MSPAAYALGILSYREVLSSRGICDCSCALLCAAWALAALPAAAAQPAAPDTSDNQQFRLDYRVHGSIEGCFDDAQLRDAVRQRLGRDPWSAGAADTFEVRVTSEVEQLRAVVRLVDRDGQGHGKRRLHAPKDSCAQLGSAIALAVSIAIDPTVAASPTGRAPTSAPSPDERPASTASATRPSERSAAATPAAVPAEPRASRSPHGPDARRGSTGGTAAGWRPRLALAAGGLVALGSAPAITGGFQLELVMRWSWLSLGLAGRFDLPASRDLDRGKLEALLGAGEIAACGRYRALFGCAVLLAGAISARGTQLADAHRETLPYVGAGPRIGAIFDISRSWGVRAYAELIAPFGRVSFNDSVSGARFWRSGVVSGSLTIAVVATLL